MNENNELKEADFLSSQPIEGVPLVAFSFENFGTFSALAYPLEIGKTSDNESYAIIKGKSKAVKITVKTTGSGNVRKDPVVTLEEVDINVSDE